MRSHSYLNSAKRILDDYDGNIPFSAWLKEYFRNNKKFGSKDRKQIADLCFGYFRTYHLLKHLSIEDHLITGLYLTSANSSVVINELKEELQSTVENALDEKINPLHLESQLQSVFPFNDQLSSEIDPIGFCRSYLVQPDLFLRIRPGKGKQVLSKLVSHQINFTTVKDDCIQLNATTPIDKVINTDEEAVIQDVNSQSVLNGLYSYLPSDSKISMWDCCAASGGKSILFHDHYPNAAITVSDIRESILHNLETRFRKAGILRYKKMIADLSTGFHNPDRYDVIICDAPCSGSGTWSRTPEQLKFFTTDRINQYAQLQQKIVRNVSANIKKDGYLLYITCSVFKKENEDVVSYLTSTTQLNLIHQQYLKGYADKADTLFAALFKA